MSRFNCTATAFRLRRGQLKADFRGSSLAWECHKGRLATWKP